jgi:integrative and conjugative element protein (TIGR02256 family)
LYFEPPASVSRTWTAQNFLRRVQWWLEQSAKGQLHSADQPVEQLFFVTGRELVLPWNFDELRRQAGQRFVVRRSGERPDRGETYFIVPVRTAEEGETAVVPIEVDLPPIIQGHIERDPTTLGELSDLLLARGVNLLDVLQAPLKEGLDERGKTESKAFTIILLHIPVLRIEGGEPERTVHRAFLAPSGPLRLGVLVGALVTFQGKYFRDAGLSSSPAGDWRPETIFPMEVLSYNTSAKSRAQSGISDAGPDGVLVGAGALGTAMLDLWSRSGWGRWTVIDKDHVKPHNLVRHRAYAMHVGQPKADVVAQLHEWIVDGASRVTPLVADAMDVSDARVRVASETATLIVDASTTLEYPRLASNQDGPRHASVFITPSANAAVLMTEDAKRSVRLRALEAQYYRAAIQEPWGAQHLAGNLGTFWSGASCRDISVVLPYSRVAAHAALLAEQIQHAVNRPEATIRIWTRDQESGAVAMHEATVSSERSAPIGDLTVYIDEGLENKLRSLRRLGLPEETGGVLLGYHDFNVNALVLVDAIEAPADSRRSTEFFERGVQGLSEAVNEASRRTAGVVGYVGEWHSHPAGFSSDPSGHDLKQLVYLAVGMADDGLSAVSVIVSDEDVRIMAGVLA